MEERYLVATTWLSHDASHIWCHCFLLCSQYSQYGHKAKWVDLSLDFPAAAKAVNESFYVDNNLTGIDFVEQAISLWHQLQMLARVVSAANCRTAELQQTCCLESHTGRTKTCNHSMHCPKSVAMPRLSGLQWNPIMDHFCLKVTELPPPCKITKCFLVSDIAKTFNVSGWYAPCVIKIKIFFPAIMGNESWME